MTRTNRIGVAALVSACVWAGTASGEEATSRQAQGPEAGKAEAAPAAQVMSWERPENIKVEKELDETRVTVAFNETPVLEALDRLHALGKVNIVVDRPRFEEAKTVTLRLADVRLGMALTLITEQIGMKFAVRDGVAFISDEANLTEPPVRAVYDVRDLLKQRAGGEEKTPEELIQDLTDTIKQTLAPGTWDEEHGYAARPIDGTIVIAHAPMTHRQVRAYLAGLRRALAPVAPAAAEGAKPSPAMPELPGDRPENRRIREALDTTRVSVAFADTPLFDALDKLAAMGKVNIVPDRRDPHGAAKGVTLRLDNVPLAVALAFLTRQNGMRCAIRDGVVCVGDSEDIEGPPIRVVYDALDLSKPRAEGDQRAPEEMLNDLIDTIKQTIVPGTWDEESFHAIRGFQGTIVVVHAPSAQHEVRDLLAEFRRIRAGDVRKPAEHAPAP